MEIGFGFNNSRSQVGMLYIYSEVRLRVINVCHKMFGHLRVNTESYNKEFNIVISDVIEEIKRK